MHRVYTTKVIGIPMKGVRHKKTAAIPRFFATNLFSPLGKQVLAGEELKLFICFHEFLGKFPVLGSQVVYFK